MPESLTSGADPAFVCEWKRANIESAGYDSMVLACAGELSYKVHDGKEYCVLHCPQESKSVLFRKALQRKLANKDFNFCGVWFPEAVFLRDWGIAESMDFRQATFNAKLSLVSSDIGATLNFAGALFKAGVDFADTDFKATADFSGAIFEADAEFYDVDFHAKVDFSRATFNVRVGFESANFAEADFNGATFGVEADSPQNYRRLLTSVCDFPCRD